MSVAAIALREWAGTWRSRSGYLQRSGIAGGAVLAILGVQFLLAIEAGGSTKVAGIWRWAVESFLKIELLPGCFLAAAAFARGLMRDREGGMLDLLLLSPARRFGIIAGQAAGRWLDWAVILAAFFPAIVLALPMAGMTLGKAACLQVIVLGHLAVVAGICGLVSSFSRGTLSAILAAWLALGSWFVLELIALGPTTSMAASRFRHFIFPTSAFQAELRALQPDWGGALGSLAYGLGVMGLLCAAGAPFLEWSERRRRERQGKQTLWQALRLRAGQALGAGILKKIFRPVVPLRHPLMRLECSIDRDRTFQVLWFCFTALFVAAMVALIMTAPVHEEEPWKPHFVLALAAGVLALAISIALGVLRTAVERGAGTLEVLLAANMEPDDMVRAKLAGMLLRAGWLMIAPAAFAAISIVSFISDTETLLQIPRILIALAVGAVTSVLAAIVVSMVLRRPIPSVLFAMIVAMPFGACIAVVLALDWIVMVVLGLLWMPVLGGMYFMAASRMRKAAFRV